MMARASSITLPRLRMTDGWSRRRRRPWSRHLPVSPEMMMAAIPSLPRVMLARLTARLIDRMDYLDGDCDIELNGDESDHTAA